MEGSKKERKEEKGEEKEKAESKETGYVVALLVGESVFIKSPRNVFLPVRSAGLICCLLPRTLPFGNKSRHAQDGQGNPTWLLVKFEF